MTRLRASCFGIPAFVLGLCACGGDDAPADDQTGTETDGEDESETSNTGATVTQTTTVSTTLDDSGSSDATVADSSSGTPADSSSGSDSGSETVAGCEVVPPASFEAPEWAANTTEALAIRAQLDALVGAMRLAEQDMDKGMVDLDALNMLRAAGEPSLDDIVSPGFVATLDASIDEFVALDAFGDVDLVNDELQWDPGVEGGVFGSSDRGINEGGLEVRQIVDKGMFAGGALYAHAVGLTTGDIDEATVDALAALYGANETLGVEMGTITDSNNYAYQMGFHAEISASLIAAKAYAADEACVVERDEAIVSFFRSWEQSMFARMVYYSNEGAAGIELAVSDDDFAGALHEQAEGFGLIWGFHGLENPATGPLADSARVATDEQIAEILMALRVDIGDLEASTYGTFVEDYMAYADAVATAEDVVIEIFGLEPGDLDAWRMPTAG